MAPQAGQGNNGARDGWLARSSRDHIEFVTRVFIAVAIALSSILLLLFVWYTIDVFFLVFGSILLAVLFRALGNGVAKRTGLQVRVALGLVTLTLLGLLVAGGWLLAPSMGRELGKLGDTLPTVLGEIEAWMRSYQWGQLLLNEAPQTQAVLRGRFGVLQQVTGIFSTTAAILANTFIVLALAFYLAASPDLYKQGALALVPPGKRLRAEEIIHTLGTVLQRWLLGRAASMVIVGVLVGVGLWFLNVPLALALGFVAGLFTFIPYIGPILGIVPALLVATTQGGLTVLYVIVLYGAVEQLESFLLVPIVQEIAVKVPPALTIVAQVLLGLLFGVPGLILASPLTAVLMIVVKMVYVEDLLGDTTEVPGEESEEEQAQRLELERRDHAAKQKKKEA